MRMKFWIRQSLVSFGLILLMAAVYSLMLLIMTPLEEGLSDNIGMLTIGSSLIGCAFIGVFTAVTFGSTFSLALGFGSTRREALLGLQLCRLTPALLMSLIISVIVILLRTYFTLTVANAFGLVFGAYLLLHIMGSWEGMLLTRTKKLAAILLAVVFFVLLIGGVALLVRYIIVTDEGGEAATVAAFQQLIIKLDAAALLLWLLTLPLERRFIRRFEVRT